VRECAWRIWERAAGESAPTPRERPRGAPVLVREGVERYVRACADIYREGREGRYHAYALRAVLERLGDREVESLAVADLLDCREDLIERGYARKTINHFVGVWRLWAGWMMENRLCSASAKVEIVATPPLKPRRSRAPEPQPVRAVPHWQVKAAMRDAPPSLRAMVYVQELSGMRPGEVCAMRAEDVDRRGRLWIYRPAVHKNDWRGMPRAVVLGPRAQKILRPYLAKASGPVFSPALADREWRAAKRAARKSPVQPSQRGGARRVAKPEKRPGATWLRDAYTAAVAARVNRAVRAGIIPERWSPNQLRHACATRVRLWFGLEAAKGVLGHSMRGGVTDVYSFEAMERESIRLASPAMERIG